MILTNKDLKIRFSLSICYALMARLYPSVNEFKILRRTEALENYPILMRDLLAIVCFYKQVEPIQA